MRVQFQVLIYLFIQAPRGLLVVESDQIFNIPQVSLLSWYTVRTDSVGQLPYIVLLYFASTVHTMFLTHMI